MVGLEVPWPQARGKAEEDARKMQAIVEKECQDSGKPAPDYELTELIGKGSFGRVYKATGANDGKVVAVKIIDVDESDTVDPKLADTYSEFLKEVNALQVLREGGAQNINYVLEALPVGRSMWMVTEYCAGGSVATLMKPTAPGGLQEKWIIPILREVAVAIFWVHKQGIIHRDIKCANVLVTEDGGVQLCDFGVAGMMESKFDKRSTFIGTPHWMAPELFDANASYGTEVDIWAFGSMVYEIASGLPPNVGAPVGLPQFGGFLREHIPRLEGAQYSDELRSLVAFCLVESPKHRPTIKQIQSHPYINGTEDQYPTSSLASLVRAYKLWEQRGNSRKSLFNPLIGAQGPSDADLSSTSMADEWNFSTTLAFDQQIHDNPNGVTDFDAVRNVYGSQVDFPAGFNDETQKPKPKGRRRPPPQVLNAIKAPLEKVFDPNTISNYNENSQAYYGLVPMPPPPSTSDLPLRDDNLHSTLRESLIDLDASLGVDDLSQFASLDTIRAGPVARPGPRGSMNNNWSFSGATDPQYSRAPLSDPAELNNTRPGPDWQWPTVIPPASASAEITNFTFDSEDRRPPLIHQQTEPLGLPSQGYELQMPRSTNDRMSVSSLIDLDEGLVDPEIPNLVDFGMAEYTRPSTANSDVPSMTGSEMGGGGNPFELERHASVYAPASFTEREPSIYVPAAFTQREPSLYAPATFTQREPSIYVSDASQYATLAAPDEPEPIFQQTMRHQPNMSDASQTYIHPDNSDYTTSMQRNQARSNGAATIIPVAPPAASIMEGTASTSEVTEEMRRLVSSLSEHLTIIGQQVAELEPRRSSRISAGRISEEDIGNPAD
ncbi:kinase-like domain-containing protein [Truncatella angustata]|uniref:non-specific serine/threonine protein kinase n=1 Tax=Truncatella angustata TaxID=152316 RepID=A0A9P8UEU3_9PEZI|nr:kinase-like domain-containing protein [Truncatella angustata]KAH6648612.1 kinase-like domain-containing protein [Truncatella angustata]